jgi:hypothetical protein
MKGWLWKKLAFVDGEFPSDPTSPSLGDSEKIDDFYFSCVCVHNVVTK